MIILFFVQYFCFYLDDEISMIYFVSSFFVYCVILNLIQRTRCFDDISKTLVIEFYILNQICFSSKRISSAPLYTFHDNKKTKNKNIQSNTQPATKNSTILVTNNAPHCISTCSCQKII